MAGLYLEFCPLQLLHMLLKKAKVLLTSESHAAMVDPFVKPLCEAINSEQVAVILASLRCMHWVLKYKGIHNALAAANGSTKINVGPPLLV